MQVLGALSKALESLARSNHRKPDTSAPGPRVRELDVFDGTDPKKLHHFLIQCELTFRSRPGAFRTDFQKVTFAQSYLKGMALE